MLDYKEIHRLALKRAGSTASLAASMPEYLSNDELRAKTDDRYLSDMSRRVFQAGLSWKMINNKWPNFEKAFFNFNTLRCSFINDDEIEAYMQNTDLVRYLAKIKSIPRNAFMMEEIKREHGSFGEFLAQWPDDDHVGLWRELKKRGDRLGGMSGPIFLRIAGKDTFLLSDDVVATLINYQLIDKMPTSQKALAEVQSLFNDWQQQSGKPMCEISRMLSLIVDQHK